MENVLRALEFYLGCTQAVLLGRVLHELQLLCCTLSGRSGRNAWVRSCKKKLKYRALSLPCIIFPHCFANTTTWNIGYAISLKKTDDWMMRALWNTKHSHFPPSRTKTNKFYFKNSLTFFFSVRSEMPNAHICPRLEQKRIRTAHPTLNRNPVLRICLSLSILSESQKSHLVFKKSCRILLMV